MAVRIGVLGACDTGGMSFSLKAMLPSYDITPLIMPAADQRPGWAAALPSQFDRLAINKGVLSANKALLAATGLPMTVYPQLYFRAFHPDCCYAGRTSDRNLFRLSQNGAYHSALCIGSFLRGLPASETITLFNHDVFAELGYLSAWDECTKEMSKEFVDTDLDFRSFFLKIKRSGAFMHSFNHPKIGSIVLVARMLAASLGASRAFAEREIAVGDGLAGLNWPLYPEIADNYSLRGAYLWSHGDKWLGLADYIATCYAHYEELGITPETVFFRPAQLPGSIRARPERAGDGVMNPYRGQPDHQFWSRAMSWPTPGQIDPMTAQAPIAPGERVVTMGSCFAQHLARNLARLGLNYHVAEAAPDDMPAEEARKRNFGVFSARFGNVYTVRQAVQLYERAFGTFTPEDDVWTAGDDFFFVDAFRPQIEPAPFFRPKIW